MMQALIGWWRSRTARERQLMLIAAGLGLFAVAPLSLYSAAAEFRERAAAELTNARRVLAEAQSLQPVSAGAPLPGDDGSVRGLSESAAQGLSLQIARIEPAGPERVRLAMRAVDAVQVYRWMEIVARRGAVVERAVLVRAGEGVVDAEFEIAAGP